MQRAFVAALAVLGSVALAPTAHAKPVFVTHVALQGALVDVQRRLPTEDPSCDVIVGVFISAFEATGLIPPGGPATDSSAQIDVITTDLCTSQTVFHAQGEVAGVDFDTITNGRTSASLTGSFTIPELVSGGEITVDVDVTWTGTKVPARIRFQDHILLDGGFVNVQSNQNLFVATVAGSASFGDQVIDLESDEGLIGAAQTGSQQVTQPAP